MSRTFRITLITSLSIMIVMGFISLLAFVGLPLLCGNEIVKDVASPDGRHRAILFVRHCGDSADYYTQVALVGSSDDLPNQAGNVLSAPGKPQAGAWAVKWTGAGTLTIRTPPGLKLGRSEKNVDGIAIQYEPGK